MCASELPPNPGEALVSRTFYSRRNTGLDKPTTALKPAIASSTPFYWSYPPSFQHGARQIRHFRYASHPTSPTTRHFSFAAQQRVAAVVKDDHRMAASRFRSGLESIAQATPSSSSSAARRPSSPSASSSSTSKTSNSAASTASTTTSISTAAIPATTATSSGKPAAAPTTISKPKASAQQEPMSPTTAATQDIRRVNDLEAALATARTQQHRLAMELEKLRMQQQQQSINEQNHHRRHHHHHDHGAIRRPSAPAPVVPSIFSSSMSHSPSKRNSDYGLMMMSSSPPRMTTSLYGSSHPGTSSIPEGSPGSDEGCNCCCGDSGSVNGSSGSGTDDGLVSELMAEAARSCERQEGRVEFQREMAALRDRIYTQAEELSERRKERKKWDQEKERLMMDLKEKEERINKLIEGKRDSVQG